MLGSFSSLFVQHEFKQAELNSSFFYGEKMITLQMDVFVPVDII